MRQRRALILVAVTCMLVLGLALGFALIQPAGAPLPMHP